MKKSKVIIFRRFSVYVDKLKKINSRLRNKLKDLNVQVEKAIEKANQKRIYTKNIKPPKDPEARRLVKQKEIENAQAQLDNYEYETYKLQEKLE